MAPNTRGSQTRESKDRMKTLPTLNQSKTMSTHGAIKMATAKTRTGGHAERAWRVIAQTIAGMPQRTIITPTTLTVRLPFHRKKAA